MTSTFAPGDRGFDYSYSRPLELDPASKWSLAQGVAAGARFAIRYSAGAASDPAHPSHNLNAGKLITPAEHKTLLAAGYDVVANSEWYESRITEGAYAGHADGVADLALWRSCGHARGASVYVSWDADPVPSKWPAADAYLAAHNAAMGGYYFTDCYAGTPYLRHALGRGLIRHGWRPNAGIWSGDGLAYQPDTSSPAKRAALVALALPRTPAAIWQTGNYWFGKTADELMLLRPNIGSHLQALHPPAPGPTPITPDVPTPIPTPKGETMLLLKTNNLAKDGYPMLVTGGGVFGVPHLSDEAALKAAGVAEAVVSLDLYKKIRATAK